MNSRSILLLGWLILAFFWILTPSHSQFFVPETSLQDQSIQQGLDTAYDRAAGEQSTTEQKQGLEQAQNAWLNYRAAEAAWEAGTTDVNSAEFQKAMSRITQARIEELQKVGNLHFQPQSYPSATPEPQRDRTHYPGINEPGVNRAPNPNYYPNSYH
jgi:hypothetical protein